MKKILSLLVVALLIPQLAFGWGLQRFVGDSENFPHGITFLAIYDAGLDADYSVGSATATFAATRSATTPATYFDASGVMQKTTTSNVGRFNYGFYDTSGFTAFTHAGLMVESASTNYLTYGIFSAGAGTATGWAIDEDDTNDDTPTLVDVSDTFNVGTTVQSQRIQMTFDGDGTYLILSQKTAAASFAQNDNFTTSCWVKGSSSGLTVALQVKEYDDGAVVGTTHSGSDFASSISATEWRRFTYSDTADDADCDNIRFSVWIGSTGAADTMDLQVASAQIEKSPFATSFIPTTTAALTRNAETLKYPTLDSRTAAAESCAVKLSFEKTLGMDINAYISDTDTKSRIFDSDWGQVVNIRANFTDSPLCRVADLINTALSPNTEMTLGYAIQHSSPYIAGYYNGVADGTNETTDDFTNPAWGTYFWIGSSNVGNIQLNGTILGIAFFDRVLSAAEMQFLHDKDWRTLR